jgi:hypothetical protein
LNGKRAFVPLVRAIIAEARASAFEPGQATRVAKRLWPNDAATIEFVQRATAAVATTGDATWAGPLAGYRVQDVLQNLGPLSAGSELENRNGLAVGGTVTQANGTATTRF